VLDPHLHDLQEVPVVLTAQHHVAQGVHVAGVKAWGVGWGRDMQCMTVSMARVGIRHMIRLMHMNRGST
jgi:hypothetical protein